MSNAAIVDAWLAVSVWDGGPSKTDALGELNQDLNTAYTLSRIGQWQRGQRPISPRVRAYMISIGIGWLLTKHGIPYIDMGDAMDRLAEDLA